MARHFWQAGLAVVAWTLVLVQVGVPPVLAVLIPMDVAVAGLAFLARRSLQTRQYGAFQMRRCRAIAHCKLALLVN
jgi:hypothetical protein